MRPMHVTTASIASGDALLDAARAGDSHALVEWLRREQALLGEFAQRLCRDDEVAKDVVQESMGKADVAPPELALMRFFWLLRYRPSGATRHNEPKHRFNIYNIRPSDRLRSL